MGYVYISYSHKDKPFVERLSHDLQAEGVSVWIDYQAIQPGEDWQSMIDQAIKGADAVLFVSSANSVMRAYITVEVGLAQANHIPVIVLVIDEDGLAKMPRSAQGLRRLDFRTNHDTALEILLAALPESVRASQAVTVPEQPQSKGYVFISYAEEDTAFVVQLREFLKERGYGYWDYQDSDRNYQTQLFLELEEVIQGAKATLSVLSPDWKRSSWAAKEMMFSNEVGTPVFLLMAREMGPTLVTAGIPYIDFTRDAEQGFARLDKELRRKGLIV